MLNSLKIIFGALLLIFTSQAVNAEIVADNNAPDNQRPSITSKNGVTHINIQTPNTQGISRNTFSQFDVDEKGVVLNNLASDNPPLINGGPAKVILIEINSNSPSSIKGPIEVKGDEKTHIIFSNPLGLIFDGGKCKFTNVSRATLATGVPIFTDGNLLSLRVENGEVSTVGIEKEGFKKTFNLERADIFSHKLSMENCNKDGLNILTDDVHEINIGDWLKIIAQEQLNDEAKLFGIVDCDKLCSWLIKHKINEAKPELESYAKDLGIPMEDKDWHTIIDQAIPRLQEEAKQLGIVGYDKMSIASIKGDIEIVKKAKSDLESKAKKLGVSTKGNNWSEIKKQVKEAIEKLKYEEKLFCINHYYRDVEDFFWSIEYLKEKVEKAKSDLKLEASKLNIPTEGDNWPKIMEQIKDTKVKLWKQEEDTKKRLEKDKKQLENDAKLFGAHYNYSLRKEDWRIKSDINYVKSHLRGVAKELSISTEDENWPRIIEQIAIIKCKEKLKSLDEKSMSTLKSDAERFDIYTENINWLDDEAKLKIMAQVELVKEKLIIEAKLFGVNIGDNDHYKIYLNIIHKKQTLEWYISELKISTKSEDWPTIVELVKQAIERVNTEATLFGVPIIGYIDDKVTTLNTMHEIEKAKSALESDAKDLGISIPTEGKNWPEIKKQVEQVKQQLYNEAKQFGIVVDHQKMSIGDMKRDVKKVKSDLENEARILNIPTEGENWPKIMELVELAKGKLKTEAKLFNINFDDKMSLGAINSNVENVKKAKSDLKNEARILNIPTEGENWPKIMELVELAKGKLKTEAKLFNINFNDKMSIQSMGENVEKAKSALESDAKDLDISIPTEGKNWSEIRKQVEQAKEKLKTEAKQFGINYDDGMSFRVIMDDIKMAKIERDRSYLKTKSKAKKLGISTVKPTVKQRETSKNKTSRTSKKTT